MEQTLADALQKMQKTVEHVKADVATLRTSRATPTLVENMEVEAYSGKMKLIELAHITAPEHNLLLIQPWDQSIISSIVRAIQTSNLGLTPVAEAGLIRITIPPLTEERRRDLIKLLHQKLEAGKVMLRQVRHEARERLERKEKNGEISEDQLKHGQKELEDLVEKFMGEIEGLGEHKEKELLEV